MEKVLFYRPKNGNTERSNEKKLTRSECIAKVLKENPRTLEDLILKSTKLYESQYNKQEGVTWETYRIWKIVYPALITLEVPVNENLKPEL
ncbi:MAG: hypothetical protein WBJ87_07405 [Candidatus Hydrothermia bacterium]